MDEIYPDDTNSLHCCIALCFSNLFSSEINRETDEVLCHPADRRVLKHMMQALRQCSLILLNFLVYSSSHYNIPTLHLSHFSIFLEHGSKGRTYRREIT